MININILTPIPLIKKNRQKISFDTKKCIGIFTYLTIYKDEIITRERLASLYWADFSEERARRNLNDTLWRIRKTLQKAGVSDDISIISDRSHISIKLSDQVIIDIHVFIDLLNQAWKQKNLQKKIRLLEKAIEIHKSPLLYEMDEPWLEELRIKYLNKLKNVRNNLIDNYKIKGQYLKAIDISKLALKDNPYDEYFAYELILLYYLTGNISQAMKVYENYYKKLSTELNLEPGQKINTLLSSISSGSPVQSLSKKTENFNIPDRLPLIGRNEEMKIFKKNFYNTIKNNVSTAIIIEGDAGMGKSLLLEHILRFSKWHNLTTIITESNNIDEPPPYLLIGNLIRQIADIFPLKSILSAHILHILSTLLPDLIDTIDIRKNYNHLFFNKFEKNYLYQAVEKLFIELTEKRPVILLIDDIHSADKESLELLLYIMDHIKNCGILIIMTKRPKLKDTDFTNLLNIDRSKRIELIKLQPLSFEAISQIVANILCLEKFTFDGDKERFVQKLKLETGGNPLFLKETIRYWLEKNILKLNKKSNSWSYNPPLEYPKDIYEELPEDYNIPEKIYNLFKIRISFLDDSQKEFVEYAAVSGYKFNVIFLKNILEISDEKLIDIIDLLIEKGIFVETDNVIRFSHRKQREFVYISLSNLKKNLLHKKIYNFSLNTHYNEHRLQDLAWHSYKASLWKEAVECLFI